MRRRASIPEGKTLFSRVLGAPWRPDSPEGKALFFRAAEQLASEEQSAPEAALPPADDEQTTALPSKQTARSATGMLAIDVSRGSLVGHQLGPFRLLAELGRGGVGTVYRAQQPGPEPEVAVKVVHSWLAGLPGFTGELRAGLRLVARLRHQNIVAILDVGEAEGHQYVVSELVEGRSLDSLIREEGPLPPERALRIALQIAVALDYAHAAGIAHGDVKPSNVVVSPGDHITLTDFGLARLADASVRVATSGAILGTPDYMSPEQIEGKPITTAADRYAFGVLLFELLAGRPPFRADSPVGVLMDHVGKPPPRLSSVRPGLPSASDAVLARALAKDPTERSLTCSELVLAAAAALGAQALAESMRPRTSRRAVLGAVGVGLAVLAVGVATILPTGLPGLTTGSSGAATATVGLARSAAAVASMAPTATIATSPSVTPAAFPSATLGATLSGGPAAATSPSATPTEPPRPSPTPTAGVPSPTAIAGTPAPSSSPSALSQAAPTSASSKPSGTLVLVRRNQLGANDLHRMPLATGSIEPLASPSAEWRWAPAPSPDGEWIAFATGLPPRADIAIMRRDGSGRTVIARSGELNLGSPWWMPDGRIAFNGDAGNLSEIFGVSREGGAPVQLTRASGSVQGTRVPTWPREGGFLVFAARQGGLYRVFTQPPGASPKAISPDGANAYPQAWAPDASRIAFSGVLADGQAGIFTMAPDGGDVRRVAATSANAWACCPAWSFDGAWIAYVSNSGASAGPDYGDVYLVPATGGEPMRVTLDGRTYNWRVAWLP